MLRVGMIKSEIEQELEGKGNFVQANELNEFLKEPITMEMKKFILLKLAEVYEKMKMLKEAAKMCDRAAMISIAFSEKIKHYLKEAELYIRSDAFDLADSAMKKAMAQANEAQREEIYNVIKDLYKKQAEEYENSDKRAHAARVYEKLLQMRISDLEKKWIKEKLLIIYDKLGKRDEYLSLEKREF